MTSVTSHIVGKSQYN